jgi:hypothetical protein
VQFDAYIAPNTWLLIGYGDSLVNTDVLFYSSDGTQMDMYSYSSGVPVIDAVNAYKSQSSLLADGMKNFVSTRVLDFKVEKHYTIKLDTPIKMVCAWFDWSPILQQFPPSNYFTWEMTLNSDGTSKSKGGIKPINLFPLVQTPNGSLLKAWYDSERDLVEFDVTVMPNSWFSIGFGS